MCREPEVHWLHPVLNVDLYYKFRAKTSAQHEPEDVRYADACFSFHLTCNKDLLFTLIDRGKFEPIFGFVSSVRSVIRHPLPNYFLSISGDDPAPSDPECVPASAPVSEVCAASSGSARFALGFASFSIILRPVGV